MNQFFYQITRKASDLINSDDYLEFRFKSGVTVSIEK